MSVVVFAGPTITQADVHAILPDARCLPPAAQGDVLRAARQTPRAIGIVDGFFSGAPSVWHKEILWALSQGVQVFGSASMGALRAAELYPFGMRGVGRIFTWYRDGHLEDDDEVAVIHGPQALGYLAASEPMVNIRATLMRARDQSVIEASICRDLEMIAKALFFPHRCWPEVLAKARERGLNGQAIDTFERWLPTGRVDQKRDDAIEMLLAIDEWAGSAHAPTTMTFTFERTEFFEELSSRCASDATPAPLTTGTSIEDVLDELRLEGPAAVELHRISAVAKGLLHGDVSGPTAAPSAAAVRARLSEWRRRQSLLTRDELAGWLDRNSIDEVGLLEMIAREERLAMLLAARPERLNDLIADELLLSGAYERLAARARQKALVLGAPTAGHGLSAPDPPILRAWYFAERRNGSVPDDLAAYVHSSGFADVADFDRALQREWAYEKLCGLSQS